MGERRIWDGNEGEGETYDKGGVLSGEFERGFEGLAADVVPVAINDIEA